MCSRKEEEDPSAKRDDLSDVQRATDDSASSSHGWTHEYPDRQHAARMLGARTKDCAAAGFDKWK